MDLMCKCQRQEQQVADLRKLIDDIAKLESGAPDVSGGGGGDNSGNWETQSVCSDVSGVGLSLPVRVFLLFRYAPPVLPAGLRCLPIGAMIVLLCGLRSNSESVPPQNTI